MSEEYFVKNSRMVAKFMQLYSQELPRKPKIPCGKTARMRIKLIIEEVWELSWAMWKGDLVGIADALCDLLYVVYGMALAYGIPIDKCFREVHRSNLSKLGADGKPIYRADGKVIKPEGWQAPDLRKVMGI